jgi:uncharacterized membrane protein YjgN (DUF898 family)
MVIRGYGLILLTLGLYRFWLNRDTRRWYRNHIVVLDDRFEYLGTAHEHLRGFLIALAVALPLNAVFFFANVWLGSFYGEIAVWVAFGLLSYLATFASYQAERFRWARTSWRGIRFGLDGSGWAGVGVDPVSWTPLKSCSGVSHAAFSKRLSAGVPAADGRVGPIGPNA